jgi:hypothetical protein
VSDQPYIILAGDRTDEEERRFWAKRIAESERLQAFLFGPDNANLLTWPDLTSNFIDMAFLVGRDFDSN